jgi:spore coat polysaccharide biosynthesis protein SpsF
MSTIAIIQARMGSSRLPGKVMLPLDCRHSLDHVNERARLADSIDETVIATTNKKRDDIIAQFASDQGMQVFRGSGKNVLNRFYQAAKRMTPEKIVRVTGDCPLLSPDCVDYAVKKLERDHLDYVSCSFDMTFPRGLTAEVFTFDSFETVREESSEPRHQEHVTPYYREHTDSFAVGSFKSDEVFADAQFHNRTDLRLTLDEVDDYRLLKKLYDEIKYDEILTVQDAIEYIDSHELSYINTDVKQKSV